MTFGNFNDESQRDSGLKPRVVPQSGKLPRESRSQANNPNGVVARRGHRGATQLGLKTFPVATRGNSARAGLANVATPDGHSILCKIWSSLDRAGLTNVATLGNETQSLWAYANRRDSHSAAPFSFKL